MIPTPLIKRHGKSLHSPDNKTNVETILIQFLKDKMQLLENQMKTQEMIKDMLEDQIATKEETTQY